MLFPPYFQDIVRPVRLQKLGFFLPQEEPLKQAGRGTIRPNTMMPKGRKVVKKNDNRAVSGYFLFFACEHAASPEQAGALAIEINEFFIYFLLYLYFN
jgi:hypothetical protein